MLDNWLYVLPGLLLAFVLHELAHGLVATALGDPTPRQAGRLTLNPIAHIDFVGFLLLFAVGFGWAKPVLVNPGYFANPRAGMALVAAAGPLANFILAYLALVVLHLGHFDSTTIIGAILYLGALVNVSLGIFNLIPIPPLDGSKVLAGVLPGRQAYFLDQMENYGWFLLILLMFTGIIGRILFPLRAWVLTGLNTLASFWAGLPAGIGF